MTMIITGVANTGGRIASLNRSARCSGWTRKLKPLAPRGTCLMACPQKSTTRTLVRHGVIGPLPFWPTHKELLRIEFDRERIRSLDGIEDLARPEDRKSTRLNSSHLVISYAVFCLKKKKKGQDSDPRFPGHYLHA